MKSILFSLLLASSISAAEEFPTITSVGVPTNSFPATSQDWDRVTNSLSGEIGDTLIYSWNVPVPCNVALWQSPDGAIWTQTVWEPNFVNAPFLLRDCSPAFSNLFRLQIK